MSKRPTRRLILPANRELVLPESPFERRMRELGQNSLPPPGHPAHEAVTKKINQMMDGDVEFERRYKKKLKRLNSLCCVRMQDGCGLLMADQLRWYFQEFANRLLELGPSSFPTSFNVVESFLKYNEELVLFDIRREKDFLLSVNDFIEWYTGLEVPLEPSILCDVMEEGVVYSYNMASDSDAFSVKVGGGRAIVGGVSLIRHDDEVSCILVAGENPPLSVPDYEKVEGVRPPGKEGVRVADGLTKEDRYLSGYPGHGKVIVLSRFSTKARRHDVRYINIDAGKAFVVLTDDWEIITDSGAETNPEHKSDMLERLSRYDRLYSLLSVLTFLPVAFVDLSKRCKYVSFSTQLHTVRKSKTTKRARKQLGKDALQFERKVQCLSSQGVGWGESLEVHVPTYEFVSEGYWRPLAAQMVGVDRKGNPIVGKTWVERSERWETRTPSSFLVDIEVEHASGENPGYVYIVRCPAHPPDTYKIGRTERTPEERARDLTGSTAAPLPFGILASWFVPDCHVFEETLHEELAKYRMNERREFFRVPLQHIVAVAQRLISSAQ